MKKLYTFLLLVTTGLLFAQPTSTLVTANYFGSSTKTIFNDLSKQTLYYYTQFPFDLKRIESNNSETTLLSRSFTSNWAKAPVFNNNKGIFIVPKSASVTNVYFFNNSAIDSFVINQDLTFTLVNTKDFVIGSGSNPSYFWIQNQFYKTNLTGAGTSTISLTGSGATYSVTAAKETNNKLLVAAKASNGNKYVFYYDGTTASKIDSMPITVNASTRYEGFTNPANNDAFMIAVPGFISDSSYAKIWKLTSTGAPSVLSTSQKLSRAYTTLTNKLIARIYTSATNKMVTIDLNTGNLTPIIDNTGFNISNTQSEYFQSNGSIAYFAGYNNIINVPCFTNGLTLDTVTTKSIAQIGSNLNGAFCGNDYWFKNPSLKTEILTSNKTFTIIPQTNTSTQTSAPIAAYSNIYYFKDNASFNYDLYKSACVGQVGINELTTNQIRFNVYPNPTTEMLNVNISTSLNATEMLNEPTTLTITNILGEVVLTKTATTQHSTLSTQHLNSGVYFLQVGNSKAVKFIKE